jgi:hypothetical protein
MSRRILLCANDCNADATGMWFAMQIRMKPDQKSGPLDGSTSGTIGGGGAETGGGTPRPIPPEARPVNPDDAASGRLAPDPLGAATPRDDLKPGPSDVTRE